MFLDTFPFQKCLETEKTTKSREKNYFFKGFGRFFGFQTLLKRERCLETGETAKSFEYRNNDFCDTHTLHHYIYIIIIIMISEKKSDCAVRWRLSEARFASHTAAPHLIGTMTMTRLWQVLLP